MTFTVPTPRSNACGSSTSLSQSFCWYIGKLDNYLPGQAKSITVMGTNARAYKPEATNTDADKAAADAAKTATDAAKPAEAAR